MKRLLVALILISGLTWCTGCSTDFDMYSEYKDVTIVYSIVDISDDTTWVKVTRAFTGPGNALLLAQNPDSSNYPYKLDVTMVGKKNDNYLDPIVFDTITIHNKAITDTVINADGDTVIMNPFYSPNQLVYYAVGTLDEEADYTLSVNKKDGNLSGSTSIVEGTPGFYISKPVNRIVFSNTYDSKIEWSTAKNGKRYELSLMFNYLEFAPDYSDTLRKSVYWFLAVKNSKSTDGNEGLETIYSGANFFSLLESELEPIANVERWSDGVDVKIACGSQTLTEYIDINSGGGNLLEEVPLYSNIDGGIGVFASRHTIVKTLPLSTITEGTLIEDYDLGFKFKSK